MTDRSATETWRRLLRALLAEGEPISQDSAGASFRGRTSYELLAHRTVWPMTKPVILCPERKLGYRFLTAEAAWVLSGSNRLDEIAPFAKNLKDLSDDGVHLYGAYGPAFRQQLPYVLDTLTKSWESRQAVSTIWHPRPGPWKDIPCTIGLQYLIRSDGEVRGEGAVPGHVYRDHGVLHCVASMRSSDAWLGVPYDIHTFSMTAAYVALMFRDRNGWLPKLGNLYLNAGSQHLYQLDREPAERCVWDVQSVVEKDDVRIERTDEAFEVAPIDLARFAKPDDLIRHLWAVARQTPEALAYDLVEGGWLTETIR